MPAEQWAIRRFHNIVVRAGFSHGTRRTVRFCVSFLIYSLSVNPLLMCEARAVLKIKREREREKRFCVICHHCLSRFSSSHSFFPLVRHNNAQRVTSEQI